MNMKKHTKLLSGILCVLMLLSTLFCVGTTSYAVSTDTAAAGKDASTFSWDNATVYFLLTDRFYNGNTSNDHSYNRLKNKDGSIVSSSQLNSDVATFHGGDFAGITKKINEGYFDKLGVNALWISAPYEQIHGYVIVNEGRHDSIKHYAYHGYYALDYTQTDANFGTAAEFKTMVDTAHQHNIRIVLDIVMNHPGYNTIYDMREYNYGTFKVSDSEIDSVYYNWTYNGNYHNIIDYTSSNAGSGWANWWGKSWLRAGITGYDNLGNDSLTGSAGGSLPDFKTENSATVSIPTFLQNKWQKEGRATTVNNKMNSWFSSTGKQKTVRNYLVCWLSDWVREYGVDGFRCDTAKHVELASWKALSDECTSALKEWRSKHKSDPAGSWTDDFWMTAEDYGSGVNYDNYYSQGGFDSKINFSFTGGGGVPGASSINNTYSDYASRINSNDKFNVLTYISSHDTALCRNDLYYQGSAFLMLPGAVQIFYGDESARPVLNSSIQGCGDHLVRSDMNWSSTDSGVLAHWQKVGSFRNRHVAVGAGTHNKVDATSGLGFARVYNKNGVNDTIVAVIGASNNTNVKVKVSPYIPDGLTVTNAYDGKTAVVSGGYVTFNSGAHGTILIETSGMDKVPSVSVDPAGGSFKTNTLTVKATLNDAATSGTYQVGSKAAVSFTKSANITIGADINYDDTVTIKFTATDGKTTTNASYTYTKVDPNATPFKFESDRVVYLLDTASWGAANIYAWKDGAGSDAAWPGNSMEKVGDYDGHDVYKYTVPATFNSIIFSNSGNGQTPDLTFQSHSYYDNGAKKWVKVDTPVQPSETQAPSTQATTPVETQPSGTGRKLGDSDLDDTISIMDVTAIQRDLAKLAALSAEAKKAADVDGSGVLEITDATYIQRYLANLPTAYKIGQRTGTPVTPTEPATQKPTSAPATQAPQTQAPETQSDGKRWIYADFGFAPSDAKAYYWKSGGDGPIGWPGVDMQSVSGNIFKAEVPEEYDMIIFHCSNYKSGNLTIPAGKNLYTKNADSWSVYGGSQQETQQSGDINFNEANAVFAVNDGSWGAVYVHYWGGESSSQWPGAQMEKVGSLNGHDLYKFTVPAGTTGLVFNIGSDQVKSGDLSPTPGMVFSTSSKSFISPN